MKKTITTLAIAIALFASCKKEDQLNVGDSKEKIVTMYGQPSKVELAVPGAGKETKYYYYDRNLVMYLFDNKFVQALKIR